MEVEKYDRENNSIIVRLSVDELEVIAEAFRQTLYTPDEFTAATAAVAEKEPTAEGIMEFAYCSNIVRDVLKNLPGQIDDAIEFYRNLQG